LLLTSLSLSREMRILLLEEIESISDGRWPDVKLLLESEGKKSRLLDRYDTSSTFGTVRVEPAK